MYIIVQLINYDLLSIKMKLLIRLKIFKLDYSD